MIRGAATGLLPTVLLPTVLLPTVLLPTVLLATVLLATVLLAAPCAVDAQSLEDFETARRAYEDRDYARAAQYFEELVGSDPPRLTSPALILESRKLLGSAYLFLGRRDAAIHQFELMLRQDPAYPPLDPLLFPAAVQELFNNVRDRLRAEASAAAEREALEQALARERERSRALLAIADEDALVEVENSRLAALLPWGIGQFLNGDDGLGWFFFLAETAFAVAAVGSLAWHDDLYRQISASLRTLSEAQFDQANRLLDAATYTNWISLGVLGAFALAGVLEAQFAFTPSRSVRHERRVPDELREGLEPTGRDEGEVGEDGEEREDEETPPSSTPAVSVIPFGLRF